MKKIRLIQLAKTPDQRYLKRKSAYVVSGILLFLSLSILEIWLVNRLVSFGQRMHQLMLAQTTLELENQLLENQLASKTSLNYLSLRSEQLGFASSKNVQYLKPRSVASAN